MASEQELLDRIADLEARLEEAEGAIAAIRSGDVDAVVVSGPQGERVYTLEGADEGYRRLVEEMSEGALTLRRDGFILFSNEQFAQLLAVPLERVIGSTIQKFVAPEYLDDIRALLWRCPLKAEVEVISGRQRIPVYLSSSPLQVEGVDCLGMVVTDLREQKRNERVLAAERLARSILDQAGEAILVLGRDGIIKRASRAARTLAGRGVIFCRFDDVFPLGIGSPPQMLDFSRFFADVDASRNLAFQAKATVNGTDLDLLVHAAPLTNPDGEALHAIVNLTDITALKRIERSLRESEARERERAAELEAILDAVPAAVLVAENRACTVITANAAAARLLGTPDRANISLLGPGARAKYRLWEDGRELTLDELPARTCARTGQPVFNREFDIRFEDGTSRHVVSNAVPLFDHNFQPRGAVLAFMDITDRQRSEEALRESEERFRAIADNIPQLAWMAEANGSIFWYNRRWFEYTGTTYAQMNDWGWRAVHHPEHLQRVEAKWRDHLKRGDVWEDTFPLRGKDGQYRWFLSRAVPIRDAGGAIVRWFGTNTDVTEQKRTEEALRRSNEDLEQFAYVASHDLQEPLRMVASFAAMLGRRYRGQLDEEADRFIDWVVEGATRLQALLHGLLEFSRLGNEPDSIPVVDSGAALDSALHNLESAIVESGAIVTVDPLPPVRVPDLHLAQLFQNLVGNAIKHRSDAAPRIHVSACPDGVWHRFAVQDNGIGIQPEYREYVFKLFKRLRQSSTGTGIGLAICKRIIDRQGGRIWVESEPGQGSTFFFTLPAAHSTVSD
jgi:PAS domain S-box-containing protein